jgi:hypothetical protein
MTPLHATAPLCAVAATIRLRPLAWISHTDGQRHDSAPNRATEAHRVAGDSARPAPAPQDDIPTGCYPATEQEGAKAAAHS